jgi:hypothetical protein
MNNAQVDGGFTPLAAVLARVISAVFMHVVKPRRAIAQNGIE